MITKTNTPHKMALKSIQGPGMEQQAGASQMHLSGYLVGEDLAQKDYHQHNCPHWTSSGHLILRNGFGNFILMTTILTTIRNLLHALVVLHAATKTRL